MRVGTMKSVGGAVCIVGALSLLGTVGCGNKSSDGGSGVSAGSGAAGAQKPEYTDEAMAFMLGRKYAFACLYTRLDKPAEADGAIKAAQTIARALGVSEPTLPTKDGAFAALRAKTIPDEVTKKKSAKVAAVVSLGVAITDAWFGAVLGSDPSPALADVETNAKAAGLDESVYKAQLADIKAKPTDDKIKKLAGDLEAYYKK